MRVPDVPADRLLITVAPTGAETAKADCPQLPTTLEEQVATAVECQAAGAAMIHLHIRDDDHRPTLELSRLKDAVDAIREATELVVQLSTGGSVHDPLENRLKVLDAEPDSCSLTMGTTNFGDDVFLNPWPFVCELYQLAQERGVAPEFELFDLGQVHALQRLLDRYGLPAGGKVHCDLVMGVPGGMNGTADALVAAVAALPDATTSWSATGIGRSTLAVALAALSKGGHLRVGMEDVLTISRGVPVESNRQLVERVVELGRIAQRTPMTPGECRELLGITTPVALHRWLRRLAARTPGGAGSRTPSRWASCCWSGLVILALPFRNVQSEGEAAKADLQRGADALRAGDIRAANDYVVSARATWTGRWTPRTASAATCGSTCRSPAAASATYATSSRRSTTRPRSPRSASSSTRRCSARTPAWSRAPTWTWTILTDGAGRGPRGGRPRPQRRCRPAARCPGPRRSSALARPPRATRPWPPSSR